MPGRLHSHTLGGLLARLGIRWPVLMGLAACADAASIPAGGGGSQMQSPEGGPSAEAGTDTTDDSGGLRDVASMPDAADDSHAGNPCDLPNYPDASCTGVPPGTTLTPFDGDMTITTLNTVVDAMDVKGCILVQAPGVVIRRSRVSCPSYVTVSSFGGAYTGMGLLVEDSEIDCQNTAGATAVGDTNVTARRLNIHGCEKGFDVDSDFHVEDCYVHDLYQSAVAHTDGVLLSIGNNVTIHHNRIYANDGTCAIITNPTMSNNLVISDNLLAGGAFSLYCPLDSSVNVSVLDNHFGRTFYPNGGEYGPWTDCDKVAVATGNVWDDTGQLIPF